MADLLGLAVKQRYLQPRFVADAESTGACAAGFQECDGLSVVGKGGVGVLCGDTGKLFGGAVASVGKAFLEPKLSFGLIVPSDVSKGVSVMRKRWGVGEDVGGCDRGDGLGLGPRGLPDPTDSAEHNTIGVGRELYPTQHLCEKVFARKFVREAQGVGDLLFDLGDEGDALGGDGVGGFAPEAALGRIIQVFGVGCPCKGGVGAACGEVFL